MTLQCIKITENDWTVSGGATVILTDRDALAQRIKNRIALWKGEWYQDTSAGVDYLTIFGMGSFVERRLSVEIKEAILADPLVISVNSLNAELDSEGNITLSYSIESEFGTITGE